MAPIIRAVKSSQEVPRTSKTWVDRAPLSLISWIGFRPQSDGPQIDHHDPLVIIRNIDYRLMGLSKREARGRV